VKCELIINDTSQIGNEILAYMVENPKAQDTLEGIVEWWLLERKVEFVKVSVKEALSELVAKKMILEKKGPDSQIHYRINRKKQEEIKKFVKLTSG